MIEDLKRENELLRTILDLMGQVEHWKAKYEERNSLAGKYRQLCSEMINNGLSRFTAHSEFSRGAMDTYQVWINRAKLFLRNETEEEFLKLLKEIEDYQEGIRKIREKLEAAHTAKKGKAPKPGTIV